MRSEKGRPINNERLEFLGDAILDAIVGDIVYRHFEGRREGFLTNTRSKIVQRETLNKLAVEIGLDKLVKYSTRSSSHNSYMYGNAFEAFIGAIYLDQGYDRCKQFMEEKIFKNYIDLDKMSRKEVNFKSKLIEWSQKNKMEVSFEAYRAVSRRRIQSDVPHRSPHRRDIGRYRHRLFQEGVATKCGTDGIEKIKDAAFKEEVQAAKERNHATETSTEENPMAEAVEESPQEKLAETDSHPTSLDN